VKAVHSRLSLALLAALITAAAHAQQSRTFVSTTGDDFFPCARTAPCRTFAGALLKTISGGEINVLDAGSFGAVTITKSVTIDGEGTFASILHSGGANGIVVNAGAEDRVVLRNLAIHGAGSGANSIRFLGGRHLVVDNVVISGFTGRGIDVQVNPNGSTAGIDLRNVRISKAANNASTPTGVFIGATGTGLALATLDRITLSGLDNGLEVGFNGRAKVRNSTISGNKANGILASHPTAVINVEGSQIAFNELVGVNAAVSGATIRIANNGIYNNTSGITIAAGATVSSAGNNRVAGNAGSASPNGGAVPLQ
jgi:hypothetical protein